MFSLGCEQEVLGTVVKRVMVDVVDYVTIPQLSSKDLGHYDPVDCLALAINELCEVLLPTRESYAAYGLPHSRQGAILAMPLVVEATEATRPHQSVTIGAGHCLTNR